MQSSIANGKDRSFADTSSFDHVVTFMPDVEVISVDPNAYYTSDDDDDDFVSIDDDPADMLAHHQAAGAPMRLANEGGGGGAHHESQHLMPDTNLFDVIALNINDDLLPDLQYDDIFLTNGRVDDAHPFDLASYIDGDSSSMLLSPLDVPSMAGRRPFDRTSLARQRISFSVDADDEPAGRSHLGMTASAAQSTVNAHLHNNRIRAKAAPCDIDRKMYVNGGATGTGLSATVPTKRMPAAVEQRSVLIDAATSRPADVEEQEIEIEADEKTAKMVKEEPAEEPAEEMLEETIEQEEWCENVKNSQIVEAITIDAIKMEEPSPAVDVSDDCSMSAMVPAVVRPVVAIPGGMRGLASMPPASSPMTYISDDSSMSSTPSNDSNYKASAEVTETSNENSPQHTHSNGSNMHRIPQTIEHKTEPTAELPTAECKPNTKRKLNIQEYLRRKTLKTANELRANGTDAASSAARSKFAAATSSTAEGQQHNGPSAGNKSLYEEIIVVSMGCNTDISIPPPSAKAVHTNMAKSTALLCNIQTAVEKLSSTADSAAKLSSSSLISSIQDVILKKSSDAATGCTAVKPRNASRSHQQQHDTNDSRAAELEHGENKVIMHLPRDRVRPMNWSVATQSDPYFQFPPLELLLPPPAAGKKAAGVNKEHGDQSRDSQFYSSPSYSSRDGSSSDSSSTDDDDESSMSTATESSGSSDYSSSRSHYNDHQRKTFRKRRSSTSSGYNTYGSSKRSTSPEERRIVYVGRIEEHATRSELHRKFSKYGTVKQISLHRKEGNDDRYGFITFDRPSEAYGAIDDSPRNPEIAHYSISFGGRRAFCRQKYYDLDNIGPYASTADDGPHQSSSGDNSFDMLLRQMQSKMRKQPA